MPHPKDILNFHNIQPKKSLGQNFLFDENVLDRIVAAADLQADDVVLEVGPGLGHLTGLLAETAVSVTAVELDNRFLPILHNQFDHLDHVRIIHGDNFETGPDGAVRSALQSDCECALLHHRGDFAPFAVCATQADHDGLDCAKRGG